MRILLFIDGGVVDTQPAIRLSGYYVGSLWLISDAYP